MSNLVIEVKTQEPAKTRTDQATLGADLLGPLVAAVFGIWVMKLTKRIEQNQWRNQKLIEKRFAIWDKIGPIVKDIHGNTAMRAKPGRRVGIRFFSEDFDLDTLESAYVQIVRQVQHELISK